MAPPPTIVINPAFSNIPIIKSKNKLSNGESSSISSSSNGLNNMAATPLKELTPSEDLEILKFQQFFRNNEKSTTNTTSILDESPIDVFSNRLSLSSSSTSLNSNSPSECSLSLSSAFDQSMAPPALPPVIPPRIAVETVAPPPLPPPPPRNLSDNDSYTYYPNDESESDYIVIRNNRCNNSVSGDHGTQDDPNEDPDYASLCESLPLDPVQSQKERPEERNKITNYFIKHIAEEDKPEIPKSKAPSIDDTENEIVFDMSYFNLVSSFDLFQPYRQLDTILEEDVPDNDDREEDYLELTGADNTITAVNPDNLDNAIAIDCGAGAAGTDIDSQMSDEIFNDQEEEEEEEELNEKNDDDRPINRRQVDDEKSGFYSSNSDSGIKSTSSPNESDSSECSTSNKSKSTNNNNNNNNKQTNINKGPLHQSEEELLSPNEDVGPEFRNTHRKLLSIGHHPGHLHQVSPTGQHLNHLHHPQSLYDLTTGDLQQQQQQQQQFNSNQLANFFYFPNGIGQSGPMANGHPHQMAAGPGGYYPAQPGTAVYGPGGPMMGGPAMDDENGQSYLIPPPANLGFSGSSTASNGSISSYTTNATNSTSTTTTGCLIAAAAAEINRAAEEAITSTSEMTTTTTTETESICDSQSDQQHSVIYNRGAGLAAGSQTQRFARPLDQSSVMMANGSQFYHPQQQSTNDSGQSSQMAAYSTATTAPLFGDEESIVSAVGLEDGDDDEDDEEDEGGFNLNGERAPDGDSKGIGAKHRRHRHHRHRRGHKAGVVGKISLLNVDQPTDQSDQTSDILPLDLSPGSISTSTSGESGDSSGSGGSSSDDSDPDQPRSQIRTSQAGDLGDKKSQQQQQQQQKTAKQQQQQQQQQRQRTSQKVKPPKNVWSPCSSSASFASPSPTTTATSSDQQAELQTTINAISTHPAALLTPQQQPHSHHHQQQLSYPSFHGVDSSQQTYPILAYQHQQQQSQELHRVPPPFSSSTYVDYLGPNGFNNTSSSSATLPRNMTIMNGGGGGGSAQHGSHVAEVYEPKQHPVHKYWTLPRNIASGFATGNGYDEDDIIDQHQQQHHHTQQGPGQLDHGPPMDEVDRFNQHHQQLQQTRLKEIAEQNLKPIATKTSTTSATSTGQPQQQDPTGQIVQHVISDQNPPAGATLLYETDNATFYTIPLTQQTQQNGSGSMAVDPSCLGQDAIKLSSSSTTTTYAVPKKKVDDGIGPVNADGVPIATKAGVKQEHGSEWYKTWVRKMHKMERSGKDQANSSICVKVRTPRFKGTDYHLTVDNQHPPSKLQSQKYVPGNIEDYEPGRTSSILQHERQMDSTDSQQLQQRRHLDSSQVPPSGAKASTLKPYYHENCVFNTLTEPAAGQSSSNMGYDSDSGYIIKKKGSFKQVPKPASPSVYRAVQRGDIDIPLCGLQRPAPVRSQSQTRPQRNSDDDLEDEVFVEDEDLEAIEQEIQQQEEWNRLDEWQNQIESDFDFIYDTLRKVESKKKSYDKTPSQVRRTISLTKQPDAKELGVERSRSYDNGTNGSNGRSLAKKSVAFYDEAEVVIVPDEEEEYGEEYPEYPRNGDDDDDEEEEYIYGGLLRPGAHRPVGTPKSFEHYLNTIDLKQNVRRLKSPSMADDRLRVIKNKSNSPRSQQRNRRSRSPKRGHGDGSEQHNKAPEQSFDDYDSLLRTPPPPPPQTTQARPSASPSLIIRSTPTSMIASAMVYGTGPDGGSFTDPLKSSSINVQYRLPTNKLLMEGGGAISMPDSPSSPSSTTILKSVSLSWARARPVSIGLSSIKSFPQVDCPSSRLSPSKLSPSRLSFK